MMKTGHSILGIRSTFGKISPGKVMRKSKAIRNTDKIGDCRMTPAGGVLALQSFSER